MAIVSRNNSHWNGYMVCRLPPCLGKLAQVEIDLLFSSLCMLTLGNDFAGNCVDGWIKSVFALREIKKLLGLVRWCTSKCACCVSLRSRARSLELRVKESSLHNCPMTPVCVCYSVRVSYMHNTDMHTATNACTVQTHIDVHSHRYRPGLPAGTCSSVIGHWRSAVLQKHWV